jgi:hypothetical protein
MPSLAEFPALVGFFSYSREDDQGSGGRLSKLRERIQEELRLQLGRTKKDFRLWQDTVAIAHGELWEDRIKKAVSESVFFIPIITPTAVRSSYCKFEFEAFLARERELDRDNLIFPILYVPVPALRGEGWRQDPLLSIVGSRQYEDWQNLRHLDASSSEVVALRVQTFCANICKALEQEWLSPEERQQAEARRVAEGERRRQQAEDRSRLADAEAQKDRQDEEGRRLERVAAKEEQRRKRLEQAFQQPVKPWLLPLIGAGAASLLPTLVLALHAMSGGTYPWVITIICIIGFLYGGAAGMVIRRFGILKAMAFPVIPYVLSIVFVLRQTFTPGWSEKLLWAVLAIVVVPTVMCTLLAFWLHSLWYRRLSSREAVVP